MRGGALVAALLLLGVAGCKRAEDKPGVATERARAARVASTATRPSTESVLRVARATGPIKPDGELDEPAWNAIAARTGAFVDASGGEARPYSDARFLWDADNLYVGLYAADNDIRAQVTAHDGPVWIDDSFALHLTLDVPCPDGGSCPAAPTYAFDISASGVVTDVKRVAGAKDDVAWESGVKVGVDRDGTINDSHDEDEEWVVEAVIPLRSMGIEARPGTRVLVDVSRCDTPRNTKEKRCGSFGSTTQRRVLELAP